MPILLIISFITAFYEMKDNGEIKSEFFVNTFYNFFYFSAIPSSVVSGTMRVSRYLSLPFIKNDSIAAL